MKELNSNDQQIAEKIYLIRGIKVMIDRDLAEMYDVKPIRLREQVKRNSERFPDHFMFQLLDEEVDFMVSQNAIPSRKHLGGSLPYAFTEHGILMLANVIKSQRAIAMSIKIIEVFVKFREMLISQKDLLLKFEQLEKLVVQHDNDITAIFQALKQLIIQKNEPREPIGFKFKK
ncbi:ORF6N domain-containing protein [Mucilaginibacter sp. KACC 22063]|uniref:ORF6N domain-containing protein n=1 Tax=Mucilaginibacter sp. KACC 22063 TaxID=3025666 RepID=UPI0023670B24|nr:ORF6N domain-containing protein [Mucilaginibacter sp. KACC 22063]WDF54330.1 ORF6N domain-containing protein [Mucilaginibacter sp. KACC 22063]